MHVDCLFDYGVSIYRPAGGYTPMPSASDHEGKLNYSVHVHTPHGDSLELLFGESVSEPSPKRRQSTPLKASTSKSEKALLTSKQQKNVPAAAATSKAAMSTSTVSRRPKDDDSSDVAKPIPLSTFYGKSLSSNVSRPLVRRGDTPRDWVHRN